ncbi:MAG TPA: GNAT family N-acetyltransferase [Acidimicrobiales bacterium]
MTSPGEPASGTGVGEESLDNAVWWALGTGHADLAESKGRARRYPTDVSVFAGVDVLDEDSWDDLRRLAGPSAGLSLFRAEVPARPDGWIERRRGHGRQMTVTADTLADDDVDTGVARRRLTSDDVGEMLALVGLTEPGPFAERTVEMGRYWGHFDEHGWLVAMAGERLHLDGWTEISAVCTHPSARGRGLAATLTRHVATEILERGETPFLHVRADNESARRVYDRLGFAERRLVEFAYLVTPPDPA